MTDAWAAALLFSPLLLGFAMHGVCIREGWGRALARPIDRGTDLFGANKTWRGVVVVGVGCALGFDLITSLGWTARFPVLDGLPAGPFAVLLGFAVGAAAMLAELPNSLLKRRLGIPPGQQQRGLVGFLFQLLDQVDVLFGAWLVLAWFVPMSLGLLLGSMIFLLLTHPLLTVAGYALGMRATWR